MADVSTRMVDSRPFRSRTGAWRPAPPGGGAGGERPRAGDALTEVLSTVQVRGVAAATMRLSAPWGLRVPRGEAGFYAVTRGRCLLEIEGGGPAVPLGEGDLAVLPHGHGHRLCDSLASPTTPVERIAGPGGRTLAFGGPGEVTNLVRGTCVVDDRVENPLFGALPPLVHAVHAGAAPAWLRGTLAMLAEESGSGGPGSQSVVDRLGGILFVQGIRAHLAALAAGGGAGGAWLRALMDPELGPVLGLIHSRPEAAWTVASLAEAVGISRSSFATRFAAAVGQPPLSYLHGYRMQRASALLRATQSGIKEIASRVGYESEAAFSNAFKRWAGTAPGAYRRRARGGADAAADRAATGSARVPPGGP
jgi:AraC-like DNA-binding protein